MRDLGRLLTPKSIAIFGGTWALNVIEQCQKIGYDGEIWPVHPSRDTMLGIKCYRSIAELPGPVDAAYVAVNRDATIEVIAELAAAHAGGAICFASGFKESEAEGTGGAALQQALLQAAGDMPILGPNCYGLVNMLSGTVLWPDQHGCARVNSGVAVLTQSSNMAINLSMQTRGLPISHMVTVGNQAQNGAADIAGWLMQDDRVTAIGLHLEGIQDSEAMERLAAASRRTGKPVVVLKVGQSALAQAATITHSASLAGSGAGTDALWQRLGFAAVEGLPDFMDTLNLFHVHGILPGERLASVSCSGGEAALIADIATRHEIDLPPVPDADAATLKSLLGPLVTIANPLDFHTYIWRDWDTMTEVYAAIQVDAYDLTVLITDLPRVDRCDPEDWARSIGCWIDASNRTGAKTAVAACLPENMPDWIAERLVDCGIVPFTSLETLIAALRSNAQIRRGHAAQPAPLVPADVPAGETRVLFESEAKAQLAAAGVPVPRGREVASMVEATAACAALTLPLAAKVGQTAHKSDTDGVRLNLDMPGAVEAAVSALLATSPSVLLEEMVADPIAELRIGVLRDPPTGFLLSLSAGGIYTELMPVQANLLVPASREAVHAALMSLPVGKLLAGYRGARSGDMDAVLDAIDAVQNLVAAEADSLMELEINPLLVTPNLAVAADALISHMEQSND